MANLIHKLVRNKSTQRLVATLNTPQQLPKLTLPIIPHQTNHTPLATPVFAHNPIPLFNPKTSDNVKPTDPSLFYPNFPFLYFFNPAIPSGFNQLDAADVEETEFDDAGKVWADSVKKKRKKKMNKHKYKKLRKRLRRKT